MLKPFPSLILVLLSTLFLISGCGRVPQCEIDSDCPLSEVTCSESFCDDGICKITMTDDCCGNDICESPIENECSCPEDCGECEGYISYTDEKGNVVKADYLNVQCNEFDRCALNYRKEDQFQSDDFYEIKSDGIVFNVVVNYPNPLATGEDNISIEVKIVEITDPRVLYPVKMTGALALGGSVLFGQNLDTHSIKSLDDRVEISVPIIRHAKLPEENHTLKIRLSFEYPYLSEKQTLNNGSLVYDTYGRPVMRTDRDTIVKSNLVLSIKEDVTIIDLKAGTLHQLSQ